MPRCPEFVEGAVEMVSSLSAKSRSVHRQFINVGSECMDGSVPLTALYYKSVLGLICSCLDIFRMVMAIELLSGC